MKKHRREIFKKIRIDVCKVNGNLTIFQILIDYLFNQSLSMADPLKELVEQIKTVG